jgi:hypothetical protein
MKRRFLIMAVGSFTASIIFSSCTNNQSELASKNTTNPAENIA